MGNLLKSVMSVQCSKRTACLTGKGMGVVNLPELSNLLVFFCFVLFCFVFFFQAEDGIRDRSPSRGLGDVYKRQMHKRPVDL